MKIYLAGSVPNGRQDSENFIDWRVVYGDVLKHYFECECIDPMQRDVDESDFYSVFGKDCCDIKNSDLVIVNAEKKIGVGTAQEIVIAKYLKKPVIIVLPKGSHSRRINLVINNQEIEDWIHPFVFSFADFIIEKI
jgi:nucleoside 2-deoxyribosyltransferase